MLGELNEAQIEQLLRDEVVGRIGCHSAGFGYVVPITYAYADGCVYGHSGPGRKIAMMRANPHVCFEVDHLDDMRNWRSVIAWGTYEELAGEEAAAAMRLLIERLRPLATSETGQPPRAHARDTAGSAAVLYRLRLDEKTGRYERG